MPGEREELENLRRERRLAELEAKSSGIGVTPARPNTQPNPVNPDAVISQINDIEAAHLQNEVDSHSDGSLYVSRDREGAPIVSSLNEPSYRDYDPDATFLDYMPQGAGLQRQAVAMRGATLAASDEVAGVLFGDDTKDALRMLTDKAYQERPGESMALEMVSGLPAFGVGSQMLGLRTGGTVTGGVYGASAADTKDPFARTIGGLGGAAAGGILTTSGKGTIDLAEGAVNIGKRLRRASSGRPTIASNARDEFGVRLTQGQATNDINQIAFEQAAARGGRSESAGHVMRPFMDEQRESVRAAGRTLAGNQFDTANDAGAVFSEGLKRRAGQEQQGVRQAYETAKGMNATLQARGVQSMPDAVVSGLDNDLVQQLQIDPEGFKTLHPNTAAALRTVANMGNAGGSQGLPFEQLENTRRILNRAIDASASNPADKRAAVQVKRSFDRFLDDAVDQKLFEGDEGFIAAYQSARELRAEFAKNFEANKVFDRLIRAEASPEQTLEYILGAAKIAPTERVRVVIPQLKRALGEDSAEWAALQEAAMKRVMAQTDRTYNPKVLRDNLQDLLTGRNQTIAQEIFSPEQYQKLRRFQGVVERVIPPEGSVNTSGTAYEIRRQLQSEGMRIFNFPGGRTLSAAFQKYFPDRDMARARRAVRDDVVFRDAQPVPLDQLPGGPQASPQAAIAASQATPPPGSAAPNAFKTSGGSQVDVATGQLKNGDTFVDFSVNGAGYSRPADQPQFSLGETKEILGGVEARVRDIVENQKPQRLVFGAHTDQQERIYRQMIERADLSGYTLSREMTQGGPVLVLTRSGGQPSNPGLLGNQNGSIDVGGGPRRRKDVLRDAMSKSQGEVTQRAGQVPPMRPPPPPGAGVMGGPLPMLAGVGLAGMGAIEAAQHFSKPQAATQPPGGPSPFVSGLYNSANQAIEANRARSENGLPPAPGLKPDLGGAQESVQKRANTEAWQAERGRRAAFYSWIRENGAPGDGLIWTKAHEERANDLRVSPQERRLGVKDKRLVYGYETPLSELESAPIELLIDGQWIPESALEGARQ